VIGTGLIEIASPEGSAWEFLVLFLVVILGPPLVQRARVPGLIGLLIGGFLIGPHGLGLLDSGSTTIPELGQLGLLYLMFVAGVELDLNLLRRHRRSAVSFGLLTFALPMVLGVLAGLVLGWSTAAAVLLGSLLASHTLVLYPIARDSGLGNDPMIASAVGATVLTDTLALVILAVISGTQTGSGSGVEIGLQIGIGLVVLLVVAFGLLPPLARRAFRLFGADRTVRYVIAVASFLIAAVVAEMFEIEGIVGAFFAGLAMNRLVPNEGPLMNRIDFFGVAVFVPVFLVSVGLLLNPAVMVEGETLGLAALFVAACMLGKLAAAQLTRPLFGASAPQAWMVFGLTFPQAAATLAATTVGYEIGLFSEAVVNAVLVLILVSIVVSTLAAERAKTRIERPAAARRALGEHVLVAVSDLDAAATGLRLARAVSNGVAGVIDVILLAPASEPSTQRTAGLDRLTGICHRLEVDADPMVRVSDHNARTIVLAAGDLDASVVLVVDGEGSQEWPATLPLATPPPVAFVEDGGEAGGAVVVVSGEDREAVARQLELASDGLSRRQPRE
jgi:Kef-type K+ transport system membrane component KefB